MYGKSSFTEILHWDCPGQHFPMQDVGRVEQSTQETLVVLYNTRRKIGRRADSLIQMEGSGVRLIVHALMRLAIASGKPCAAGQLSP